ncbi:MAG TPA: universal stress protein, partial [Desulfosporosinus sp.]|nr:universal stress protein [Desulfosporosinus sp.]
MFKKIMVATDGSVLADKALKTAVEQAKAEEAVLTILSVIPVTDMGSAEMIGLSRAEVPKMKYPFLQEAQDYAANNGVEAKTLTLSGHPGQVIVDYLNNYPHDLVVLGHRGVSNIQALLMGSVAYKVANLAPCAVLI